MASRSGGSSDPTERHAPRQVSERLRLTAAAHERMAADVAQIVIAGDAIKSALAEGKTIFVFGNGGSAADAQHFVAELVVRY